MTETQATEAHYRSCALDYALRTSAHKGSEAVLKAAQAYYDFITGTKKEGE